MKFKLIKEFPCSPKEGTIVDFGEGNAVGNFGEFSVFLIQDCINNPNYFIPYILTTADNEDMFDGEEVHYYSDFQGLVRTIKLDYVKLVENPNIYSEYVYYKNKHWAPFPKVFQIGDLVKVNDTIGVVVNGLPHNLYTVVRNILTNKETYYETELTEITLIPKEECIRYCKEKGWIKGVKVKNNENINTILEIKYTEDVLGVVLEETQEWKELYTCTLIKPEYPKNWEDLKEMSGWYINKDIEITEINNCDVTNEYIDLCATKKQCESILAYAQLTQLHKEMMRVYNENYNDNWTANLNDYFQYKYTIVRKFDKLYVEHSTWDFFLLTFPSAELAKFSLKHHEKLWKQYYELD